MFTKDFRVIACFPVLFLTLCGAQSAVTQQLQHEDFVQSHLGPQGLAPLLRKATRGNVEAELRLAAIYAFGQHVEQNQTEATYWYRKAADQGIPAAQVEVGFRYGSGLGVSRDDAEAARWYLRAAAEGDSSGMMDIGVCYIFGIGVPKDEKAAYAMISRAADRQNAFAEDYLGDLYYFGIGTAADQAKAESWFRHAARKGNPLASYNLGMFLSVTPDHPHDFEKAAVYLRESVAGGYGPAQHSLGLLLVNHPQVNQQPGEAVALLQTSAEQGNWRSAVALGSMARDGQLLARDFDMAYFWFRVAAKSGGRQAEAVLAGSWPTLLEHIESSKIQALNDKAAEWAKMHPVSSTLRVRGDQNNPYFPSEVVFFPNETRSMAAEGALDSQSSGSKPN